MNTAYKLHQLMRWYGPQDIVPLEHIRQAGCTGVVSALHHFSPGEIWPDKAIRNYKESIQAHGLNWEVVESLPVHEAIKYGGHERDDLIDSYRQSMINLAANEVRVITYNFMPVLDWLRTDTYYKNENGGRTLFFRRLDYLVFDLFLLKRKGAKEEYTPDELEQASTHFKAMSEGEKKRIEQNFLLALPGEAENFTYEKIHRLLELYQNISREELKANLNYFLRAVLPTAEEYGLQMAIHPDDPPYSILGLPRIMSMNQDIEDMVSANPSPANGLCFCTGSFGARPDNKIPEMLQRWSDRVFFLHLRNTARQENGDFTEANHLEGDTDLYEVVRLATEIMQHQKRSIPMRPDHGPLIMDDMSKQTYPGYSGIGRLKALAELRGMEYAIRRSTGLDN